ncbi:MAG: hypothetical protein AAGN35_17775 [Bacteroidota bacterium]
MKKSALSLSTLVALLLGVILFLPGTLTAQQAVQQSDDIRTYPPIEIPKAGVVVLGEQTEDWNPFLKTVQKVHRPGMSARKDDYLRRKAIANAERDAVQGRGASAKTSATGPAPAQGVNFVGNNHNADPADNALSIGADGRMISTTNTLVNVYDSTGSLLTTSSLFNFAQGVNISFFTFDPVTVYDPVEDRFVVVFLSGSNSNSSQIVVAFSQTNNPAGSWNVYTIPGPTVNSDEWIDYPQIGLSTDELFISGNRASDGSSNIDRGSVIFQVDKSDGYSGASTLTTAFHAVDGRASLHPVEGGLNLYGPQFYFLHTNTNNAIDIFRISNTIANNGVLDNPVVLPLNLNYPFPPNADQAGSNTDLETNDVRVQSSYLENSRIEFVMNSGDNGIPAIYHGTIQVNPILLSFSAATGQMISFPDYHISFGAIAYAGSQATSGENRSFISFNYAGPTHRPGHAAVYVDETGFSNIGILRTGINPITGPGVQRWGDYSDAQERPGRPGEVWVSGTFGNQSSVQRTYISQLFEPVPVSVEQPEPVAAELTAFPSPAHQRVVFEFPVEWEGEYELVIRSLQGKIVKRLVKNYLPQGEARLAFDATYLASGTYIASVENGQERLFSKQFAVQH